MIRGVRGLILMLPLGIHMVPSCCKLPQKSVCAWQVVYCGLEGWQGRMHEVL